MADTKITSLLTPQVTTNPATDVLPIVNIADTSMASSGSTRKITVNTLLGAGGTATLASATISGDLTVDTNVFKVDTTNNRVGIGTASPSTALDVFGGNIRLVGGNIFQILNTLNDSNVDISNNGSTGVASMLFKVAGTSAMTLNSTGLLVGTVNNFASSRLCVQGTAGTTTPDVTIGIPVNSSGNTGLAIGRSASTNGYIFLDAYKAAVGGTELVLNSINGGSVLIGLSTVVAAGGCLQLKSGVTFPATQVASSDANTLDDYKEGTWTPTVTATAGTLTTTTVNAAAYTKIGRLVSIQVDISVVNIGTASGLLLFSLPTGLNQATDANVGTLRELGATGQMGQIIYQSATQCAVALYNNGTMIVNGYRFRGTYTYTV